MEPIVGKPGYTTTEFWVTVLTTISALLVTFKGDDWGLAAQVQTAAVVIAGVASGLYSWSRSRTKVGTHIAIAEQNSAAAVSAQQVRSDDPVAG